MLGKTDDPLGNYVWHGNRTVGACERGGYDFREGMREVRSLGKQWALCGFESVEVVRINDSVTGEEHLYPYIWHDVRTKSSDSNKYENFIPSSDLEIQNAFDHRRTIFRRVYSSPWRKSLSLPASSSCLSARPSQLVSPFPLVTHLPLP